MQIIQGNLAQWHKVSSRLHPNHESIILWRWNSIWNAFAFLFLLNFTPWNFVKLIDAATEFERRSPRPGQIKNPYNKSEIKKFGFDVKLDSRGKLYART